MLEQAILKTLCYADIFDWPLTEEELWRWIIFCQSQACVGLSNSPPEASGSASSLSLAPFDSRSSAWLKQDNTAHKLLLLSKKRLINHKNGFWFLAGREKIVGQRIKREKYSDSKLQIASKTARLLKLIPFVKLVGVTGGLAVGNAKKDDDIDLFIITASGRLWLTRFLVIILVSLTGKRRRPGDKNVRDKICLNMFLDESSLEIKPQDLYTAHEICQIKVLCERDATHQKFLTENRWVKKFLPNGLSQSQLQFDYLNNRTKSFLGWFWGFWELLTKQFQLYYMKHRRTTEAISDGYLRFHPQDVRGWVWGKYQKRIKSLKF